MEAGVADSKIELVYDGVPLPASASNGDGILAPATADPMKGSDLVREAARLAGVRVDFSENLERDLPAAGIFLYITRSEGLGSAALLAMAHGVPVVASRVGGLPEIVQDGITGALTGNEPCAIAEAIQRVQQRRTEMSGHARRCVEERFTVDRMVQSTRRVYQQVMAGA
jgi:glycosyltransferase involved in cell wall biosynthesis